MNNVTSMANNTTCTFYAISIHVDRVYPFWKLALRSHPRDRQEQTEKALATEEAFRSP